MADESPRNNRHSPWHVLLAGLALLALAACAPAYQLPDAPSAEQIPELEARAMEGPVEASTLVQLGAAYRDANRLDEAALAFTEALERDPDNGAAALFLGLVHEDREEWGEARQVYRNLLEAGVSSSELRAEVEARLPLLERRELEAAVRGAIAREAELETRPPDANTVAIFPFEYAGSDPEYAPLGRAMAEMLQTDLGRVGRVTLLERIRIQTLLDELQLAEEGFVDASTASRSGRILGASRIIQGLVVDNPQGIGVRAAVLTAPEADPAGSPEVTEEDELEQFYELQARMAIGVHQALGIQLTPAEEELLRDRPTQNLQALLAWGRGLDAEARGDHAEAVEHYQTAGDLDEDFQQPEEGLVRTSGIIQAGQVSTADLTAQAWTQVQPSPQGPIPTQAAIDFDALEGIVPSSVERDAIVELLGNEGIASGSRTILEIIIRRP